MQTKIFISHSSKDKPFVRKLAKELNAFNNNVWVDEDEIKIGDSIFSSVEKGLKESNYVLLILSENFNLSKWARTELEATFNLEVKYDKKIILPCLIQDTEIPLLISNRKYADFRTDFTKALLEIIDTITPKEKQQEMDIYVKDSIVTLDILNDKGEIVKYDKKGTHISLIDNNKSFNDCLSLDGTIKDIVDHIGKITKFYTESGMNFFEWQYPKILNKGDSQNRHLTATFVNGFIDDDGYWETLSNNHNAENFIVKVRFPKIRPPKKWFVTKRYGTRYLEDSNDYTLKHYKIEDQDIIELKVDFPARFVAYNLRWEW